MYSRHVAAVFDIGCSLHLQVEKFGKPTWRRLVEAVEDHVGGNNCALAQRIARDHPGVLP